MLPLLNVSSGVKAAMAEGSEVRREPSGWVAELARALRDARDLTDSDESTPEASSDSDSDVEDRREERRRESRSPRIAVVAAILGDRCPGLVVGDATPAVAAETLVECGAEVRVYGPGQLTQPPCPPQRPPADPSPAAGPRGRRRASLAGPAPAGGDEWGTGAGARRYVHRKSQIQAAGLGAAQLAARLENLQAADPNPKKKKRFSLAQNTIYHDPIHDAWHCYVLEGNVTTFRAESGGAAPRGTRPPGPGVPTRLQTSRARSHRSRFGGFLDESIALVEFSKRSSKNRVEAVECAHMEVGLKI